MDTALAALPETAMKLNEIMELVRKRTGRNVSPATVAYHLGLYIKTGAFEKPVKGFYKRQTLL